MTVDETGVDETVADKTGVDELGIGLIQTIANLSLQAAAR